ncbi:hypothetical protein Pla22_30590 [Rubripirellula amarantea]|uniref:Uncharacterized protein n=1 Tax=Rubripirellula amarantea TaxID=2527999 RepID=A0A5C5WIC4_9BACT|nr:hypothetical protein Pla22_30590 [Rubripirellula amarantea]
MAFNLFATEYRLGKRKVFHSTVCVKHLACEFSGCDGSYCFAVSLTFAASQDKQTKPSR